MLSLTGLCAFSLGSAHSEQSPLVAPQRRVLSEHLFLTVPTHRQHTCECDPSEPRQHECWAEWLDVQTRVRQASSRPFAMRLAWQQHTDSARAIVLLHNQAENYSNTSLEWLESAAPARRATTWIVDVPSKEF